MGAQAYRCRHHSYTQRPLLQDWNSTGWWEIHFKRGALGWHGLVWLTIAGVGFLARIKVRGEFSGVSGQRSGEATDGTDFTDGTDIGRGWTGWTGVAAGSVWLTGGPFFGKRISYHRMSLEGHGMGYLGKNL